MGRVRSLESMKTFLFQDHFLCAAAQKAFDTFQRLPSHTIVVEFGCQMVVGHFVKRKRPAAQRRSGHRH